MIKSTPPINTYPRRSRIHSSITIISSESVYDAGKIKATTVGAIHILTETTGNENVGFLTETDGYENTISHIMTRLMKVVYLRDNDGHTASQTATVRYACVVITFVSLNWIRRRKQFSRGNHRDECSVICIKRARPAAGVQLLLMGTKRLFAVFRRNSTRVCVLVTVRSI